MRVRPYIRDLATPGHERRRRGQAGQALPLFVLMIFVITGSVAIVTDVSWFWASQQRMQRAADAGALAGAVFLPGDVPGAYSAARKATAQNGYTNGTGGVIVTPLQDAHNKRRLIVTVTGPVSTYFARVFGLTQVTVSATSRAEFTLPVPMGSPENYYGNFGKVRGYTTTTTVINHATTNPNTGWKVATTAPGTAVWTPSSGGLVASVNSNNDVFAQATANNAAQQFGSFGLTTPVLGSGQTLSGIAGIEVRLSDAFLSAACANSYLQTALSWDNGAHWNTDNTQTPTTLTTTNTTDYTLGSPSSLGAWDNGGHAWASADLTDAKFQVKVIAIKGCATAGITFKLDMLEVRVTFAVDTATPSAVTSAPTDIDLKGPGNGCTTGVADCYEADGETLNPRGFWATMNTEGAANINGDAFQPYYDTPTSGVSPSCDTVTDPNRACYDPDSYYNYVVEMPAGSSGGSVYVYDPTFCAVAYNKGTGDRWYSGTAAVSSFYEVWDTKNTLYDFTDDEQLKSSGSLFRQISASDTTMGGTGGSQCRYTTDTPYGDGRDFHDRWYKLFTGLSGGGSGPTYYRIHTTGTDPSSVSQQRGANGESTFALYATASGGTPRIYGLAAMQMYTPLSTSGADTFSEFYLAQIEAVHAGKTLEIKLWDPGDTQSLAATLQIEVPTSSGWTPTAIDWSSAVGTSASGTAACNGRSASGVTGVTTNTGGSSVFNGCWLTIDVVIPVGYTAPQQGWWKIKYNMSGSGDSYDVTTWRVQVKGNPVHLVP